MVRQIALLGSTGSIGLQTLDVVAAHPDRFVVRALTARTQWEKLADQARRFLPQVVVIADRSAYAPLRDALKGLPVEVLAGEEAVAEAAVLPGVDTVVNALVGFAGLAPTLRAARAGKRIALANKESLVAGGRPVMRAVAEHGAELLPVDSEHSALFQCLRGESSPVHRLLLTASGGALRDWPLERLASVTAADALRHPNWQMGRKITVDCATMVNKGFEVMEARWLFGIEVERIEVLIHPQSIVHSMVAFTDGSVKAQLGLPDMRLPIAYALSYPERLPHAVPQLDPVSCPPLTFLPVDGRRYPALALAYEALRRDGTAPCTLNGANEEAVGAFLEERIPYPAIVKAIEYALSRADYGADPSEADLVAADLQARRLARSFLENAR